MNTMELPSLNLESFQQEMTDHAKRFAAIGVVYAKVNFSKGINQTLAMECDSVMPGFINPSNPLGGYSVQPSKTNYVLAMEELSNLHMAAIGGLVALGIALVWKIIKWFKKWRGGDEGSGSSGSGGEGGSGGSGYMPPAKVNTIITSVIDVLGSINDCKKNLVSASVQSGSVSSTEVSKQLEDIIVEGYGGVAKKANLLFDDFINKTGPVATLMKLHEGSLKEAPGKLRDKFNTIEQIINAFTSSSDVDARIAEADKLKALTLEHEATKSFWYAGDISGSDTCVLMTQQLKTDIIKTKGMASTIAAELVGKEANFTDKLRQGLHGTYEKLNVDTTRLVEEVTNDLQSKLTSLQKVVKRDQSAKAIGDGDTDHMKTFTTEANKLISLLFADVSAVGNLIHASEMVASNYTDVTKALPKACKHIITEFTKVARKNRATDMVATLNKLTIANDKLLK